MRIRSELRTIQRRAKAKLEGVSAFNQEREKEVLGTKAASVQEAGFSLKYLGVFGGAAATSFLGTYMLMNMRR